MDTSTPAPTFESISEAIAAALVRQFPYNSDSQNEFNIVEALKAARAFQLQAPAPAVSGQTPTEDVKPEYMYWDGSTNWPDKFSRWWICSKCYTIYYSPTTGKPPICNHDSTTIGHWKVVTNG